MFLFMHCVSSHQMLCDLGFVWAMIKISYMLKENRLKSSELFDCETHRRQKRVDVKIKKKNTQTWSFAVLRWREHYISILGRTIPTPYASTNHPRSEYRAFDRGFYRVIYKVLWSKPSVHVQNRNWKLVDCMCMKSVTFKFAYL